MKFFKPEDFPTTYRNHGLRDPEECAEIANAKLEREGKIVYSNEAAFTWRFSDESIEHRAILINIENIEPCTHSLDKVSVMLNTYTNIKYYQCKCGIEVVPSA